MSFKGFQEKVNPQVGHETPGTDEEAQMMELSQVQLTQIFCSAVGQALTQQMHQIKPQVQSHIKFDTPVFEGDSVASWLTGSQRVVYPGQSVWL